MNQISQKSNPSFGRAVYEGLVHGPSGSVIDGETGKILPPQIERVTLEAGSTTVVLPRVVSHRVLSTSGVELGKVVDFQD